MKGKAFKSIITGLKLPSLKPRGAYPWPWWGEGWVSSG